MAVEREGIYCVGWSFLGESDYVIKALTFERCLGPP